MPFSGQFLRQQHKVFRKPLGSLALRDFKSGRPTDLADVNLASFVGNNSGALTFSAGDLLLVFQYQRSQGSTGTAAAAVAGPATGWTKFGFASVTFTSGRDVAGMIGAWKISDGTETTVDLLDLTAGGTPTNRSINVALSFRIIGTPTFHIGTPEMTSGDPASQTIGASAATGPCYAFSFAGGQSQPAQTFATQTPDNTILEGNASGNGGFATLKTKRFLVSPANITTDIGDLGNGHGMISGYFDMVDP